MVIRLSQAVGVFIAAEPFPLRAERVERFLPNFCFSATRSCSQTLDPVYVHEVGLRQGARAAQMPSKSVVQRTEPISLTSSSGGAIVYVLLISAVGVEAEGPVSATPACCKERRSVDGRLVTRRVGAVRVGEGDGQQRVHTG